MHLIFNDCSLHGQFRDLSSFRDAIDRIMTIRNMAHRLGSDLFCHRSVANAPVMPDYTMPRAIQALGTEKQRAVMQWLTRHGPFWEDDRRHSSAEWLECIGEVVTDTAVGEAAYCLISGIDRGVVSICPSRWQTPQLSVAWRDNGLVNTVAVPNYCELDAVRSALTAAPNPIGSWEDFATVARRRFSSLTFAQDSFGPLGREPFGKGIADRLLLRLSVLDELKTCFNERGQRTPDGHRLYQMHFTGERAWFSDSSDTEKARFSSDLTFPHPGIPGKTLLCTWHGKINRPKLRLHFSWPISADEPLYVVYIGPKKTRL